MNSTDFTVEESRAITRATVGFTPREVDIYASGVLAARWAREDGDRRVLAERARCAAKIEEQGSWLPAVEGMPPMTGADAKRIAGHFATMLRAIE